MYAFIEGEVCEKGNGELVLLAGGVGYRILCPMTTLQEAPPVGETMRCYTVLGVREDAMELYGFATRDEKQMFRRLTAISGVGAKMALSILGSMPLRDLNLAIVMENVTALSRAPGVGKKTAQRIVLELKDKISQAEFDSAADISMPAAGAPMNDAASEAIEALIALGYSASEARTAVSRIKDPGASTDDLIRAALRGMAGL